MKKIFIITSIVLLVLLTAAAFFLAKNSRNESTPSEENKLQVFSENFIRDFSTYKATEDEDYNNRIIKYIAPAYVTDFADTNYLPKANFLAENKKNNYSKFLSSTIEVLQENELYTIVKVTYRAEKINAPAKPTTFIEEKAVTIGVDKDGEEYLITNFTFSTN